MKLNEIFGSPTAINKIHPSHLDYMMGMGAYGSAYALKNNPHEIVKSTNRPFPAHEDAYFTYINYITEHHLAEDNTYFPRVYGIDMRDDGLKRDGITRIRYHVNMERLESYWQVSHEELLSLAKRIIDVDMFLKIWNGQHGGKPGTLEDYFSSTNHDNLRILEIISRPMNGYVGGGWNDVSSNIFLDKKLVEALDVIMHIHNDHQDGDKDFHYDIGGMNLMFRRTGVGIQMVITDPLS